MFCCDVVLLAGGTGERLGGVSKADLDIYGRLLDRILRDLAQVMQGRVVVVAPPGVVTPKSALQTMENPPGGGPLAGIDAGLAALERQTVLEVAGRVGELGSLVLIGSVDSPGLGNIASHLLRVLAGEGSAKEKDSQCEQTQGEQLPRKEMLGSEPGMQSQTALVDGIIAVGGYPNGFDQYLQGIYRADRLRAALETARAGNGGTLHNYGVRRALKQLNLMRVEVGDECRDIDTPDDLAWWRAALAER